MEYLKGMRIPPHLQGGVVTLGNFDGVHIGHQVMLQTLVNKAKFLNSTSIVVVFEPHPQAFFAQTPAVRLSTLREKAVYFEKCGVDALIVLPFNARLAALTPETFIQVFLKEALQARQLIVGHDYHFGAGRKGDLQTLQAAGLEVIELAPVMLKGERVSSTAIREALQVHDLLKAELFLGRRYSMQGKVRRGEGRGRELGFPTANINPRRVPAVRGVFAVTAKTIDGTIHPAVANIGTRPTVCGVRTLLEIHLLDGEHLLYGERLEVTFVQYIRSEQRFESLDALKTAIASDVESAKKIFVIE